MLLLDDDNKEKRFYRHSYSFRILSNNSHIISYCKYPMRKVLEVIDKTKRKIYLTDERYQHILKHPDMHNQLEEIRTTLQSPSKIADYNIDENIKYYYKYYKHKSQNAQYLRIIVKYLNGKGFIITAYFVDKIQ